MKLMRVFIIGTFFSTTIFNIEAVRFRLRNETGRSFLMKAVTPDPKVTITLLESKSLNENVLLKDEYLPNETQPQISGEVDHWTPGRKYPHDLSCELNIEEGYEIPQGEDPYILFKERDYEFKLMLLDRGKYMELRSDQTTASHDVPGRRELDIKIAEANGNGEQYEGPIRHWISVGGEYLITCTYTGPGCLHREIRICYSSERNIAIMTNRFREVDRGCNIFWALEPNHSIEEEIRELDRRLGRKHRRKFFCCCCTD